MSAGLTIRPVSLFELRVVEALHGDAFPDAAWDLAALRSVLAMPGAFGRLAQSQAGSDNEPVGFTLGLIIGLECELLSLGVSNRARHQGIGRCLLNDFIEVVAQAKVFEVFLEVAEDNATALELYRSFKFEVVGRRPNYYRRQDKTRAAALQLRKQLA